MSELKTKQVFDQPLNTSMGSDSSFQSDTTEAPQVDLNTQQIFTEQEKFTPVVTDEVEGETEHEQQLEQVIRPSKHSSWLGTGVLTTFTALVGWQAVDSVITAFQTADWLTLGWTGFIAGIASLGLGAIGKELWKLRSLKKHFSVQEVSESLLTSDSVGKGKAFCEDIAKQGGIKEESPAYDKWKNSVNPSHSDAEVLDMYDAIVVSQQDKEATRIISRFATESAALVAVSPLAAVDMLLVAWRNFTMINKLAQVYGIELGYWSRLRLFKLVLLNMALAGASELAIDASMDLMSMDLAGKVSARAGQGLGVGILTARVGLKAMSLLRPLPWHKDRKVKLSDFRKAILLEVKRITLK
ncbi:TIGR01620 family protein [Vibrio sp. 99-70-13A1]|uniref:YcjF family protein n=1 Tax=Vibrio sp. 99-70-13A1 TaxID=2607601 RepID=UPI0014936C47|nr:TIGR01620 family protein [Vibrio sp. 99-70-13A1]NOH96900.1 TIGR01620 family protein [Vibrio sp. 99-70-13A1]